MNKEIKRAAIKLMRHIAEADSNAAMIADTLADFRGESSMPLWPNDYLDHLDLGGEHWWTAGKATEWMLDLANENAAALRQALAAYADAKNGPDGPALFDTLSDIAREKAEELRQAKAAVKAARESAATGDGSDEKEVA